MRVLSRLFRDLQNESVFHLGVFYLLKRAAGERLFLFDNCFILIDLPHPVRSIFRRLLIQPFRNSGS
jgi:hypothetical protein